MAYDANIGFQKNVRQSVMSKTSIWWRWQDKANTMATNAIKQSLTDIANRIATEVSATNFSNSEDLQSDPRVFGWKESGGKITFGFGVGNAERNWKKGGWSWNFFEYSGSQANIHRPIMRKEVGKLNQMIQKNLKNQTKDWSKTRFG